MSTHMRAKNNTELKRCTTETVKYVAETTARLSFICLLMSYGGMYD